MAVEAHSVPKRKSVNPTSRMAGRPEMIRYTVIKQDKGDGDEAADQKYGLHDPLHGLFGPEGAPAGDAGMLFFHSTQPFLVDSVSSADTRARGPCLCVN